MPYRAKHYVTLDGELYRAGDTLPDSLPKDKADWLLSADAIEETGGKEEKPRENKRRKNRQSV